LIVHDLVQRFGAAIELEGETPHVPLDVFRALLREADAVAPDDAAKAAVDALALALSVQEKGGPLGDVLIGQLYVLASALVGAEHAAAAFDRRGLSVADAAKALGAQVTKAPVSTSSLAAGKSVMALRLKR
jgi:hypothetical protein